MICNTSCKSEKAQDDSQNHKEQKLEQKTNQSSPGNNEALREAASKGQIQAVQAALNKISAKILDDHLHSCLTTAVRGEDPDERERVLKEISEVYEMATKV